MSSQARAAFDENMKDIQRLLDIHKDAGGIEKGRRHGLEVLNKSAIVLITSYWEAYCEDIASEALKHIVTHAPSPDKLPEELRKLIAKQLKEDKHELAIWKISGDGWRAVLTQRLSDIEQERNRRLNTPKTGQIDELFMKALGIPKISDRWHWPTKMTVARARTKLDKFVELRGSIAHRGNASESVTKTQVSDYSNFIKKLVGKTGGGVFNIVKSITDISLW